MSPLLFAIYVNDLEEELIARQCNYIDFNDNLLNSYLKLLVLLYADDTVVLSDSEQGMKRVLLALDSYCNDWKLKVNCDKTKIVVFSRGRVQTNNYNFKLATQDLAVVSEYMYLGIIFSYNWKFRNGELELVEKAKKAMYSLIGTSRKFDLPVDIQLQIHWCCRL